MDKLNTMIGVWRGALMLLLTIPLFGGLLTAAALAQDEATLVGKIEFVRGDDGDLSGYVLSLEEMPDAPAGSHYELWAITTDSAPVLLGEFTPEEGALQVESAFSDGLDIHASGFAMAVSIEPIDDPEPDSPHQLVITSSTPSGVAAMLESLRVDDGVNGGGSLALALEQTTVAQQHADFMLEAIIEDNLNDARNHAEHTVNTLDGKSGMFFGDLNRDGQAQNPGDGYGVRTYLDDATSSALTLLDQDDLSEEATASVQEAVLSIESAQTLVSAAMDHATKLFATDTADEATAVSQDLNASLAALTEAIIASEELALGAATMPLLLDVDALRPPVVLQSMGSLQLESVLQEDGAIQSTGYRLSLEEMPDAPIGSRYALWITAADEAPLLLEALAMEDGYVESTGSFIEPVDVLTDGFGVAISVEPEDDADPVAPDTVLISSSMASEVAPLLQAVFTDDGVNSGGSLILALEQTNVASQHAGFIFDSVAGGDLNGARNHAEHVVNILDGRTGMFFGDLNRDGQAQNPGDGYGVRLYVADAIAGATLLLEEELPEEVSESLTEAIATLGEAQALIGRSQDQATKLFAIDTTTEAEQVHAELETALLDLTSAIADSGTAILSLASFPLQMDRALIAEMEQMAEETEPVAERTDEDADEDADELAEGDAIVTESDILTATEALTATASITASTPITGAVSDVQQDGADMMPPPPSAQTGDQWTSADGRVYVFVEGGEYLIGSETEAASPREAPEHLVEVEGFWIQQTETTNAQYALCVAAGACTAPDNDRWADEAYADHPVANVSWAQAQDYAQWVGAYLPNEAQWEIACRGDDASIYPWGDLPPSPQLSNYEDAIDDTSIVGSYPGGASVSGALDMSGNVWEWTSSLDFAYPYDATDGREDADAGDKRVMRGGSFYYNALMLRCSARTGANPGTQIPHLGFRTALPASGDTWTHPVNGALYLFVPGGEYTIGSEAEDAMSREAPEQTVSVDGFWIQQTETTNAQYAACVEDGACTAPDNERWDDSEFAEHPVANVSFDQAQSYALWAGAQLPSEAQWEIACRGSDASAYPWGDLPPSPQLSNYEETLSDTAPVGSYPGGAADSGALDMSGNVWEWTSSLDVDYPYDATDGREDASAEGKRVMRGGSFYYSRLLLRCSARTGANPDTQIPHLGFRTVLSGR